MTGPTLDENKSGSGLPSVAKSIQDTRPLVPAAVRTIKRYGATDLSEMILGGLNEEKA